MHWKEDTVVPRAGYLWFDYTGSNTTDTRSEMWPGTFHTEANPEWRDSDGDTGAKVTTNFTVTEPAKIKPDMDPPYIWAVARPTFDQAALIIATPEHPFYAVWSIDGTSQPAWIPIIPWEIRDSGGNLLGGRDYGPPPGHTQYGLWRVRQQIWEDDKNPPDPTNPPRKTSVDWTLNDPVNGHVVGHSQSFGISGVGYSAIVGHANGTVEWCGHYQHTFYVYAPEGDLWGTYELGPRWFITWTKHGPPGTTTSDGSPPTPPEADDLQMEITQTINAGCQLNPWGS